MHVFEYSTAIVREPGKSVVCGIRSDAAAVPSYEGVLAEHRAYVGALAEAGVTEVARYEGDFTLVRGEELGARLLAEHPEVDGVFAANDLTAAGVLQAARAAGRSVPRTLRLVGYDDTQLGLTTHPQLTSITNPGRDLARRATRMVLDQLAGQPAPPPIIITPVLVERASG